MLWDYSVIPLGVAFSQEQERLLLLSRSHPSVLDIAVKLATIGAVDTLMREVAFVAFRVPTMPSFFLSQQD